MRLRTKLHGDKLSQEDLSCSFRMAVNNQVSWPILDRLLLEFFGAHPINYLVLRDISIRLGYWDIETSNL